jgi:hypothetical protein
MVANKRIDEHCPFCDIKNSCEIMNEYICYPYQDHNFAPDFQFEHSILKCSVCQQIFFESKLVSYDDGVHFHQTFPPQPFKTMNKRINENYKECVGERDAPIMGRKDFDKKKILFIQLYDEYSALISVLNNSNYNSSYMNHFSERSKFIYFWIINIGIRSIIEQIIIHGLSLVDKILQNTDISKEIRNKAKENPSLINIPSETRNSEIIKAVTKHNLITKHQKELIFKLIDSGNRSVHLLSNPDKTELNIYLRVIDDLFLSLFIQNFDNEKLQSKVEKKLQIVVSATKNPSPKADKDTDTNFTKKGKTIH